MKSRNANIRGGLWLKTIINRQTDNPHSPGYGRDGRRRDVSLRSILLGQSRNQGFSVTIRGCVSLTVRYNAAYLATSTLPHNASPPYHRQSRHLASHGMIVDTYPTITHLLDGRSANIMVYPDDTCQPRSPA